MPRPYQVEPWNHIMDPAFTNRGRAILVVPRRNGKDILCWNALICKALERPALYYYIAPYYNQIRQIIWEGFDDNGRRFLDYIPYEAIKGVPNRTEMRIDLVNGSQIKMQGSDEINRIVGTNPFGLVFTEYSLHKPIVWEYLRPILANNGGWGVFNGTPRSMNHMYDLYVAAEVATDWYTQYLTRDDTGIPSLEAIQADRESGMPEELIRQEYYCSWLAGSVGSFYADQVNWMRANARICHVPWEQNLPVHTAWDLGVNQPTAIWWFQLLGREVKWIDFMQARGVGLPYYAKMLRDKPYIYGTHAAPHDMNVTDWSTGLTRLETAVEKMGLPFEVMPKLSLDDGVELARNVMYRSYIDENMCQEGIQALMHYKAIVTGLNKTLNVSNNPDPKTKWASHACDAFRTGATAIEGGYIRDLDTPFKVPNTIRSLPSLQIPQSFRQQNESVYVPQLPPIFQQRGGVTCHPSIGARR